jgi:hypothetical protein
MLGRRIAAFGRPERCNQFFRCDVEQTSRVRGSLQECMPDSTASLIQSATTNQCLDNSLDLVSAYKQLSLGNTPDNTPVSPRKLHAESSVRNLALQVRASYLLPALARCGLRLHLRRHSRSLPQESFAHPPSSNLHQR